MRPPTRWRAEACRVGDRSGRRHDHATDMASTDRDSRSYAGAAPRRPCQAGRPAATRPPVEPVAARCRERTSGGPRAAARGGRSAAGVPAGHGRASGAGADRGTGPDLDRDAVLQTTGGTWRPAKQNHASASGWQEGRASMMLREPAGSGHSAGELGNLQHRALAAMGRPETGCLREGGRVEGRRVAGRGSMALPALSRRAAGRRPWVRFLPPLSEPGVPISGTEALRWNHAARTRVPGHGPADGFREHVAPQARTLAPAGRCVGRPVDALATATNRVVPFACACDDDPALLLISGVIGRRPLP